MAKRKRNPSTGPETFEAVAVSHDGRVLGTWRGESVRALMADADKHARVRVSGEWTSDGTWFGVGMGRVVASKDPREHGGKWFTGYEWKTPAGAVRVPWRKKNPPHAAYVRTHWGDPGAFDRKSSSVPSVKAGALVVLGELVRVEYRTIKGGDGASTYFHDFGPKSRPTLAFNGSGLFIAGGGYRVTERGIVG